ncbi:TenA family protein [Brucella anthropi]|uniref:TenA family protein n=1 Tax=Brucella anthropi TaxID=529 RepID=UPI00124EE7D9|nr:TenA family protein [Brucella anthropi]KAB2750706.1 TenA family transcriptional regulator [Brucella anthropi]
MPSDVKAGRFTDNLRQDAEPFWSQAVGHRLVGEIYTGTVAPDVMTRYLVQDHRFIDCFLSLLGGTLVNCDRMEAKLILGRFIGMISSDENSYFERSFAKLAVADAERFDTPDATPTAAFKELMLEAARSGSYAVCLSVLTVAEWLYLDWAEKAPKPLPDDFIFAEWIVLHDNPYFVEFVGFLRSELDRVGPAAAEQCQLFFRRAVELEKAFFDAAYESRN